jgi:dimeric dUTPase (all-alpha-NTP-PPase superfamily)
MRELLEMFELQQQLNDATNGNAWQTGVTKDGKTIDWHRCIYMESAELIDSFSWKHWKNIAAEPDWANVKIEVVDIWHFVMSEVLKQEEPRDLSVATITNLTSFQQFMKSEGDQRLSDLDYITHVEALMADALAKKSYIALSEKFFEIAYYSGLTFFDLYKLYLGKNVLNIFRQDHGYKEKSYIKEWNGEEDNVVMQRLLDENPSLTAKQLYDELDVIYQGLV